MPWSPTAGGGYAFNPSPPPDHSGTKDPKIGMYFRFDEAGTREYVGQISDKDKPYVFGKGQPTVDRPAPFTIDELAKLLEVRSKAMDRVLGEENCLPVNRQGLYQVFWFTEGN